MSEPIGQTTRIEYAMTAGRRDVLVLRREDNYPAPINQHYLKEI